MEIPILFLLVLAFVVLVPLGYVIAQFNGLVALRNHIREAWSNVDAELKRRYELIPNLVATVKGYAAHEREVLEEVTDLRNRCAANRGGVESQSADERQLVSSLGRLVAVAENYPELRADENYLQLQEELTNTEDRIQAARRFYNGNVRDYRNKCESFPSSLVASGFGFEPESFFDVDSAVRSAPTVSL
ncbi:MAG: LemA family protein [Chthoniobacterales bacterium]